MSALAPGLFSITTGCAIWSPMRAPTMRATESTAPPGANGTMTLTACEGNDCAMTGGAANDSNVAMPTRIRCMSGLEEIEGGVATIEEARGIQAPPALGHGRP